VLTYGSENFTLNVGGQIYVKASQLVAAQVAFTKALAAISSNTDMGGVVYRSVVEAAAQACPGVSHVEGITMGYSSGNYPLPANAVPVLVDRTTWIST
jgi:hypothetical protein